jgi:methylated-DNA-protein-cysteine methyltransferase-like protein
MDAETTKRILVAIRAIPRGQVAGYGEIARRAGLPGRARLVARLLSQNEDRKLPWHRVLRSDGRIAFPDGSEGFREQTARLRTEGVLVENGRVRGLRAAATPEEILDAEIWGALPAAEEPVGRVGKGKKVAASRKPVVARVVRARSPGKRQRP